MLEYLNDATWPGDLRMPTLRLHRLKGPLAGRWSASVNARWRLVFAFEEGDVLDVDFVDYH